MTDRPLIALTGGDPAGVGPEIIVQALAQEEISGLARVVVLGDPGVMA
ncbi:MAG: 4-phospho-D-threonate 3-dehydrogenase, partial [Deltaproteobacteria bacterium]|nr:4-phospho-D-threonate 3-dehydrogenase [Deltaproteobacteria bacterium]